MNAKEPTFVITLFLIAIMTISCTASCISADDDRNENEREYDYFTTPVVGGEYENPSSLDLRDYGIITSTKDQGQYGTCWAHATMSCIETVLINKGYADNTIDLSELHLVYFLKNMSVDPLGGLEDDRLYVCYPAYASGASSFYSIFLLDSWRGAVLESTIPYEWISDEPDLSEYEYDYNEYLLTGATVLNPEDRELAKKLLNERYSLAFAYYASDSAGFNRFVNEEGKTEVSYYTAQGTCPNHEVTIVGYDDNYPAENFAITPPGDGAWLIKNSWGTDSKYVDDEGYLWISYYNGGQQNFTAYDFEPASKYDNNYQYDGGCSLYGNKTYGNTGYIANVFTASGNQTLEAVSFYNYENVNVDYNIQIYLNPTDSSDPTSGTPALNTPQTGNLPYAGYNLIDLNEDIVLKKGDVFAVVVKMTDEKNDMYLALDMDRDIYLYSDPDELWSVSDTVARPGQSFTSGNGSSWEDLSSDGTTNVRLKAFTTNAEPIVTGKITGNHGTSTPASQTVKYGEASSSVVFTANEGYHFVSYTVNGGTAIEIPDSPTTWTYPAVGQVTDDVSVVVRAVSDPTGTDDSVPIIIAGIIILVIAVAAIGFVMKTKK